MEAFEEGTVEFTKPEPQSLADQRVARLATVSPAGEVDVAPVGLQMNGERFSIVGLNLPAKFRWKNGPGNPSMAVVVGDLASPDPWRPPKGSTFTAG